MIVYKAKLNSLKSTLKDKIKISQSYKSLLTQSLEQIRKFLLKNFPSTHPQASVSIAELNTIHSDSIIKIEEEKKGAARLIASDLPGKPSKKVLLKPSTSADVIKDEKVEEWNLGDYFRFLLIAAIIILLIAVIGGQAAKLSKSWE